MTAINPDTTAEGETLWCVSFKSEKRDWDFGGTESHKEHFYVLARDRAEAYDKAKPFCDKATEECKKGLSEDTAKNLPVAIQECQVALDSLKSIRNLCCPQDAQRYRLAVRLVPVS
jgi:hypothetical protein